MVPGERRGGRELGAVKKGKTVVMTLCICEESIFNKKERK